MNGIAMPNYILDQHLEEQVAEKWKLLNIYGKLMDRTEAEQFTLREMPIAVDSLDFDNLAARIHQDIFLKNNLQQNIYVDYTPHWDYCAPSIQQQILNTEPKESPHDVLAFRNQYRQYFQIAIGARKQELEALGMFADWKNSTKNLCNRNESKILTSFNKLRAQKQIETDQKLEVWCYNRNMVAEEDDFEIRPTEVLSGYVKFPMKVGFEEFGSSMSIVVSIKEIWQVVATVAIGITAASGAVAAMVTNGAEAVRVRWGTPTSSVGHYLNPYSVLDLYEDDMTDEKFIRVSSDSTIDVTYFG